MNFKAIFLISILAISCFTLSFDNVSAGNANILTVHMGSHNLGNNKIADTGHIAVDVGGIDVNYGDSISVEFFNDTVIYMLHLNQELVNPQHLE